MQDYVPGVPLSVLLQNRPIAVDSLVLSRRPMEVYFAILHTQNLQQEFGVQPSTFTGQLELDKITRRCVHQPLGQN